MYEPDTKYVQGGFTEGYKTDEENPSDKSVQGGFNMDHFPSKSKRRLPYNIVKDLSAILPAGYTIMNHYQKVFSDTVKGDQTVTIVVAGDDGFDIKIYCSHNYNPAYNYTNNHSGAAGWVEEWFELTETKTINDTQTIFSGMNSQTEEIRILKTELAVPTVAEVDDYYKGWFLYDSSDNCLGIVTFYDYEVFGATTYSAFYITLNSYASNVSTLALRSLSPSTEYYLSRFPVTMKNSGNWTVADISLIDVSFVERPNTLTICIDKGSKLLTLNFLQDNQFFGDAWHINLEEVGLTDISADTPPVVTCDAAHCLSAMGDYVIIHGIDATDNPQYAFLNDRFLATSVVDATHFEIVGHITTGNDPYQNPGPERIIQHDLALASENEYTYYQDWWGWWFDFDIMTVENKDKVYHLSENGQQAIGEPFTEDEFVCDISVKNKLLDDLERIATNTGLEWYSNYDEADFLELGIILEYFSTFSLYHVNNGSPVYGALQSYTNDIWGITMEIDGFQEIFLKRFITHPFQYVGGAVYSYYKSILKFAIHFKVDFDRRITGMKLFYEVMDTSVGWNFKEQPCYNLIEDFGGDVSANVSAELGGITSNLFKIGLNLGEQDYDQGWDNPDTRLYDYPGFGPPDPDDEVRSDFDDDPKNTGVSLDGYLNNMYWKDIHAKCKNIFALNDNNIAVNLDNESVSTDELKRKNGSAKILISQYQQGLINTYSIYSDERLQQVSMGEKINVGSSGLGSQYMLFTNRDLFLFTLADEGGPEIINQTPFMFYGCSNKKNHVIAKVKEEFAGAYWVCKNKRTICRFLYDHPEDIVQGKWKLEFEDYTDAILDGIRTGYLPRTRDVFFIINNEVWLWSILYEHWRKYTYADIPLKMASSVEGELLFSDADTIYATLPPTTALTMDKTTEPIQFEFKKRYTHGSRLKDKIPDEMMLKYLVESVLFGGEPTPVSLNINVGIESSLTNVFAEKIDNTELQNRLFYSYDTRLPGKYYTIQILSNATNDENIVNFEILELLTKALVSPTAVGKD